MPIFEFDCLKCEKQFERLMGVGANNDGKPVCPACGSNDVKKRFSKFGVRSTGGGSEAASTSSGCSSCTSSSCATCH